MSTLIHSQLRRGHLQDGFELAFKYHRLHKLPPKSEHNALKHRISSSLKGNNLALSYINQINSSNKNNLKPYSKLKTVEFKHSSTCFHELKAWRSLRAKSWNRKLEKCAFSYAARQIFILCPRVLSELIKAMINLSCTCCSADVFD